MAFSLVRALFTDSPFFQHNYMIRLGEVGDSVGDQQPGLSLQEAIMPDHLLKDVLAHVRIHGGERIVQ